GQAVGGVDQPPLLLDLSGHHGGVHRHAVRLHLPDGGPPPAVVAAVVDRGHRLRRPGRLHRLPGHQRLDDGGDHDQRHPDHVAGRRQRGLHPVPSRPSPRRGRLRARQCRRDHLGQGPQRHQPDLPVDDRHPPPRRLRIGDGPRRRGAAAGVSGAPIGDMLKTVGNKMLGGTGTTLALIMAATVLLALIGTTLACLNTGVRVTYAMAKDKEMPAILGLLHGEFATPHGGIMVLTAVSALLGIYGVKSINTLTQITLASNTGTFIVYGMTCLITVVAFASRHDKHVFKHRVIPGLGLCMNLAELSGVVYLAVKAGGDSSKNAFIALALVAVWILAGMVWVAVNPNHRGQPILAVPG